MSHAIKLMAVDDNETNLDILEESLNDAYSLELVSSGSECLSKLEKDEPNIILLDVNMPNMNGYETCEKIKADPNTSNIPVIFVSALNSLDERMKGYDAGGEDFITKPFDSKELCAKIEVTLRNQHIQHEKDLQVKDAMTTAMVAMSNASELGKIMQFLEKTYDCSSYEALAREVINTTDSFGLNCLVQIRGQGESYFADTTGIVKPLEVDLLERLRHGDKIFSFKSRTLFNFSCVSLLVKTMPEQGNLQDSLAILLNGVESQINFIDLEQQKLAQNNQIEKMLKNTHKSLEKLKSQFAEHKSRGAKIVRTLLEEFEINLLTLGLDDDQEQYFISTIDREMTKVMALYEFGDQMDEYFAAILNDFNKIISK